MDLLKAIEILKGFELTTGTANILKEPLKIAVESLVKQNPKEVIKYKRIAAIGKCPVCKTELCIDDKDLHYCPTCGQALKI